MTNDLRNRNVEAISVVRDEIQAVMERTQWEIRVVTERLAELETEREQEGLSAIGTQCVVAAVCWAAGEVDLA